MAEENETPEKPHLYDCNPEDDRHTNPNEVWVGMSEHRQFMEEVYAEDLCARTGICPPEQFQPREETEEEFWDRKVRQYVVEICVPLVSNNIIKPDVNFGPILEGVMNAVDSKGRVAKEEIQQLVDKLLEDYPADPSSEFEDHIHRLYRIGISPPDESVCELRDELAHERLNNTRTN